MVCSQSPKRLSLAIRSGWDDVPDLDGTVGDDDAVDEQLQEFSLAVEVRLLQALPHAAAERLDMGREASGFALAIGVLHEFALLALDRQQPGLGVPPAAVVLGQRHHPGEIGLREPLDLLAQPRLAPRSEER